MVPVKVKTGKAYNVIILFLKPCKMQNSNFANIDGVSGLPGLVVIKFGNDNLALTLDLLQAFVFLIPPNPTFMESL